MITEMHGANFDKYEGHESDSIDENRVELTPVCCLLVQERLWHHINVSGFYLKGTLFFAFH